jgi:hypothetical protein
MRLVYALAIIALVPWTARAQNSRVAYDDCLRGAYADYIGAWGRACLDHYMNGGQDATSNCALPTPTGAALNATLEAARNRCLGEVKAGLR